MSFLQSLFGGERAEHADAGGGDRERPGRGVAGDREHDARDQRADSDHKQRQQKQPPLRQMVHGSATRMKTTFASFALRLRRITSPPFELLLVEVLPSIAVQLNDVPDSKIPTWSKTPSRGFQS